LKVVPLERKMAESILVAISLLGIAAAAGFGVRELMDKLRDGHSDVM